MIDQDSHPEESAADHLANAMAAEALAEQMRAAGVETLGELLELMSNGGTR